MPAQCEVTLLNEDFGIDASSNLLVEEFEVRREEADISFIISVSLLLRFIVSEIPMDPNSNFMSFSEE